MRILKYSLIPIALFMVSAAIGAQPDNDEAINFKTEFIVNLIDNVTWPDETVSDKDGAVVIAVVGESPLTPRIRELAHERSLKGKKIVVKVVQLEDNLTDCQILFMPTKDKGDLARILKKLGDAPVFTVSDADYFARHGVMANFFEEELDGKKQIGFEINRTTIRLAGLKLSSTLRDSARPI